MPPAVGKGYINNKEDEMKNLTIGNFLSREEIEKVNSAVKNAEKKTAGEIKIVVVQKSTEGDLPLDQTIEKVRERARKEFFELGLDHTRDNTGVIILISLDERQVVVFGGQAIYEKIEAGEWIEHVRVIIDGIKSGAPAVGIIEAVKQIGELLAEHLPIKPDDIDEISNEIVLKD